MLQWMKRKADERKARLEKERQRTGQLRQCKKNVLDTLDSGNLPGGINFIVEGGKLPFRFQKSEHLLWVFPSVEYLEQETRRDDGAISRGTGLLAITTKHIYFNGDRRSLRIPFGKIVSVELVSVDGQRDGIGITRDRASGQPDFFVVGHEDAEFARDLILSVPSVEISANSKVVTAVEYHLLSHNGSDSLDGGVAGGREGQHS